MENLKNMIELSGNVNLKDKLMDNISNSEDINKIIKNVTENMDEKYNNFIESLNILSKKIFESSLFFAYGAKKILQCTFLIFIEFIIFLFRKTIRRILQPKNKQKETLNNDKK